MIFPTFEGTVFGIWDNEQEAWTHDNYGLLHAGSQVEIIDAQCSSLNAGGLPVQKSVWGISYDESYSVRVIADYDPKC